MQHVEFIVGEGVELFAKNRHGYVVSCRVEENTTIGESRRVANKNRVPDNELFIR